MVFRDCIIIFIHNIISKDHLIFYPDIFMFILFILMLLSCNDDNLVKRLDPGIEINEELTVGPAASREVIHL